MIFNKKKSDSQDYGWNLSNDATESRRTLTQEVVPAETLDVA